jgi:hypothetical protein
VEDAPKRREITPEQKEEEIRRDEERLRCDSPDLTFHAMLSDEVATVRWPQASTSALPVRTKPLTRRTLSRDRFKRIFA